MTESSIQSLWQPSASFLLESVVHNNSSTQMAIPTINERTGRFSKNRSLKCPCFVYYNPSDQSLSTGPKQHIHAPDPLVEQKKELITSLKRKAEDQQLSSTQNILMETLSSFYGAPKQFYQSFSIHAVIDGKCLPLVFALLADKTQDTYVFMLNVLKTLLSDIECGIVMLDFERASMNAFTQVFDQFSLMNCFFHLCQSVQRRIQKSFKVKYRTDKAFALASRLVVFLAFVPHEHIESAFEALSVHVAGI